MPTKLQVMIVEDRPADAELMVRELTKAGFEVDWQRVETESEFRRRLTPALSLILTDYHVPGFGAVPAMLALRESKVDVPLLVLSSTIGDELAAEVLRLGATDYVLKDRMARLGPAVHRALKDQKDRTALVAAQHALQRNEEQLRSILGSLDDVVFSFSVSENKLLYLNPAAEKMYGRPVQQFFDKSSLWLDAVHPEDHAKAFEHSEATKKWGTGTSSYRIIRPDASVRDVESRMWASYDLKGQPARLEGILTDVTERHEAEAKRLALEESVREGDKLRGVNEFKSQFLSMMAHDLNNVLMPLKLNLYLFTGPDAPALPTAHQESVQIMRRGVERLAGFLADMLDSARLQAGELTVTPQEVNLSQHVRDAAQSSNLEAAGCGIAIELDVPGELRIDADPRRLDQVIGNLLGNALKFTPTGGTIRIRARSTPGGAELVVADTGRGLAKEDLAKLFQPFFRAGPKVQSRHTGTGLGLFISRGIMERHGGTIRCESPGIDKGATFRIHFARRPKTDGPRVSHAVPPAVTNA